MPKISIVTAVKNGANHLAETIDSVIAQTYTDWEYIIVDDGSEDNTSKIVTHYTQKDNRIKLLERKQSGGPYIAANDGIKASTGKYIARTDGDDIMFPDRLEKQINFLKNNTNIKCVASYCQWLDANGPVKDDFIKATSNIEALKWILAIRNPLIHSSAFFEKEAFEKFGYYNEEFLSQDYRMFADFAYSNSLTVIPEVLVYFRKHEKRVTKTSKGTQDLLAREVLFDHVSRLTSNSFSQEETNLIFDMAYGKNTSIKKTKAVSKKLKSFYEQQITDKETLSILNNYLNFRLKKYYRANFRTQKLPAIINYFLN